MRANAAPRQLCTPCPKPIATLGGRSMSNVVGVLELAGVAGRGAGEEQHRVAGRDGPALELAVHLREPALILRRRQVPKDLVDRARDRLAVVDDLLPLVGVLREQHHRVADELGDGLGSGATEQRREAGDLRVVEPGLRTVAAVDRNLREPRQHVVGGVLALLGDERRTSTRPPA